MRVLVDDDEWGSSAADSRKVAKQEAARLTLNNLQQYSQVGIDLLAFKLYIIGLSFERPYLIKALELMIAK